MPGLSKENQDRLDSWAIRNYHLLWKDEKPRYRKAYKALRRATKPTFFERMLDRWRARKKK